MPRVPRFTVAEGRRRAWLALATRLAAASRCEEKGCEAYEVVECGDDFVLIERYASETAFAAHVSSPHFAALADELMNLADGFVATKGFLVEGIPRSGRGAYHVVSHHAVPEAEQKAWLDGVSFPRAAGCVGYDIVRATDAADHFVVIESWPSKGARLAHTLETDGYEEYVYSDATVDAVFRGPSRLA